MTPRSHGLLCSEFVCRSRIRTFKKTKQKDAALLCVTSGNEASNCCGGTRKRIPVSSPSTPFLPRLPWMPHANTTSISVVMSFVRRACRSFSGSFLGKASDGLPCSPRSCRRQCGATNQRAFERLPGHLQDRTDRDVQLCFQRRAKHHTRSFPCKEDPS